MPPYYPLPFLTNEQLLLVMIDSFQQGKQENFCSTEMAEAHRSEIINRKTYSFLKASKNYSGQNKRGTSVHAYKLIGKHSRNWDLSSFHKPRRTSEYAIFEMLYNIKYGGCYTTQYTTTTTFFFFCLFVCWYWDTLETKNSKNCVAQKAWAMSRWFLAPNSSNYSSTTWKHPSKPSWFNEDSVTGLGVFLY